MIATALGRALLRPLAVQSSTVFAGAPSAAFARNAISVVAALLLVSGNAFAADRVAKPTITVDPARGACVAPPAEMRRKHMDLLQHQRDRTLRLGERGAAVSLNACINCHAGKASGSVLGKGEFCDSCHAYAGVKLDCFECHQPKASQPLAQNAGAKP
jgi:hypothetical protein